MTEEPPTEIGIYVIINLVNDHFYIGQSAELWRRERMHFYQLQIGSHSNIHLQRAFNKYGEDNFQFTVLTHCGKDKLDELEQCLLDQFIDDKRCYNIARYAGAPARGRTPSPEELIKRSKALKGRVFSEDHRRKISKGLTGIKRSQRTRRKISECQLRPGNTNCIKVLQLTKDGTTNIREWEGAGRAARGLGLMACHITSCCKGHRRTHGGYQWRYA